MSENAVDADAVHHVADLARIDLEESEAELFETQFEEILEYFDSLDEVPETEPESDLANVMRPDEQRPSLDQDEALDNAAETEDGYFKGPRVS